MATPIHIPRFLLPRLSWQAGTVSHRSLSATATLIPAPPRTTLNERRTFSCTPKPFTPTPKQRAIQPLRSNPFQCPNQPRRPTSSSTPNNHPQHLHHRTFHTTPLRPRDHHFDTLKFVQRLQSEGFTESQSQAILRVLGDAISESIQNLTRTMVLREDALKTSYTQKVDFSALRTELLSLDSAESSVTRTAHERLTNELAKLNNRLRDEVQRTQASVRLDLNLEKGRIREETGVQELKIKETETRIEQEVAGLRERVEGVKFSTLQWLMGVCTGTAALMLGAWRLLM